jgi:Domain of unknown function (DUF4359)
LGDNMRQWQIVLLSIVAGCGLGGIMALTNPSRSAYEIYAVERIGDLAKDQCDRAPAGLGVLLQQPCRAAIEAYKPQLRPLLAATTNRQNWILFSIYRSDISIPVVNLNARVESIGIFDRFFTYKTP